MKEYIGTWRITEMDQWDMDYIDMVSPGRIVIDKNGQGEIHFGAVDVKIDCGLEPDGENGKGIRSRWYPATPAKRLLLRSP
jgi:hypothetical protein